MARKSIRIDMEAYERLCSVRRENESFSQVIKRVFKPPFDLDAYRKRLHEEFISCETRPDTAEPPE